MRLRVPFALLLLLLGLLAPTGLAAERSTSTLAGLTVLSGSTSGSVAVVVPRTARLGDPFVTSARGDVTITGGGPITSFALISEDPEGTRLVGASTPEVREKHGAFLMDLALESERTSKGEFVVPAGRYRLHLVTSGGGPARVALRFGGLTGSTRLVAGQRSGALVQGKDLRSTTPLSWAGGGEARMRTPFLQFSIAALRLSAHTESVGRSCYYAGVRPSGPEPYGPACASVDGGSIDFGSGFAFVMSDEFVGDGSYVQYGGSTVTSRTDEVVEADFGAGFSFTGGAVVTSARYAQFWLPL